MKYRRTIGVWAAGGLAVLLASAPLQARPRDEVMSSAFRCAAIGDSRLWLDCYYGAAQPARAALKLQPAPAAQIALAASPPQGGPRAADGAARDAVMAAAFRCHDLAEERPWLDCYYAAAQPMRQMLGLTPAPQAKAAPAGPAPAPQTFGIPAAPDIGATANQVTSRMASYQFDRFGVFTATLANGQVWRQLSGDTDRAHWSKPADHYTVRITHGFLGSYNFRVGDNPGMFKVQRLR